MTDQAREGLANGIVLTTFMGSPYTRVRIGVDTEKASR